MIFKKILYPIDIQARDKSLKLFSRMIDEVRGQDARLFLLYVVPDLGTPLVASFFPANAEKAIMEEAKVRLQAFVDEHVPDDVKVTPIVRQGTAYQEVLKAAKRRHADLIIVPSRSSGRAERWLLGSNASKIVHHAECAVLVLRLP